MIQTIGKRAARRHARKAALVAPLAFAALSPALADPFSEFVYCAPPTRPACVTKGPISVTCEEQVQLYVTSVFKYRECLAQEMERAVLEANEAIATAKCRSDKRECRR